MANKKEKIRVTVGRTIFFIFSNKLSWDAGKILLLYSGLRNFIFHHVFEDLVNNRDAFNYIQQFRTSFKQ